MKTATCALVADTSKFDGPIDQAKAKLSAFGQAVQKTASVAQSVFNIFDSARGIASGINEITTAVENVKAGMTALKSIGVNVSSALSAVGNAGKRALAGIASLPPVVKVLGGVALVSAASLYGIYKSGQAVAGIAKGVVAGIGSITARLGEMSKSAITSIDLPTLIFCITELPSSSSINKPYCFFMSKDSINDSLVDNIFLDRPKNFFISSCELFIFNFFSKHIKIKSRT